MKKRIVLLPGDGIGKEVINSAKEVLMQLLKNTIIHLVLKAMKSEEQPLTFMAHHFQKQP